MQYLQTQFVVEIFSPGIDHVVNDDKAVSLRRSTKNKQENPKVLDGALY